MVNPFFSSHWIKRTCLRVKEWGNTIFCINGAEKTYFGLVTVACTLLPDTE